MSTIIARDFSFSRDFRSVDWGATLKHSLLRACCAGLVWATVGLIAGANQPQVPGGHAAFDTAFLLALPLLFPIIYIVFLLPLGIVCGKLSGIIPFIGWVTIIFAVLIVVGDPLVCIISMFAPRIIPMHKPGFFMFVLIIWLLKVDEGVDIPISDQRKINKL